MPEINPKLPAEKLDGRSLDLSYLNGHHEMKLQRVDYHKRAVNHQNGDTDEGLILVSQDEVGNTRASVVSIPQMQKTLRQMGFDITRM